jgi:arsenate reductase
MYKHTASFEALINKRAQRFKLDGIDANGQSEETYRDLLKSHYTYLKRPVIFYEDKLYVGNAKSTIESLKSKL